MSWSQGLFNFCGDCSICLCGTFCVPCLICSNARGLQHSGLVYNILGEASLAGAHLSRFYLADTILGCVLPCLPTMLLRMSAREKYNIEGNDMEDALVSWCCTPCVNCQTAVEIRNH